MKIISTVVALLGFVLVTTSPVLAKDTQSITLKVEGMSCEMCAPAVKKTLSGIEGVKEVHVSFDEKKARVKCEQGKANVQEMIKAIKALGFEASLVKGDE